MHAYKWFPRNIAATSPLLDSSITFGNQLGLCIAVLQTSSHPHLTKTIIDHKVTRKRGQTFNMFGNINNNVKQCVGKIFRMALLIVIISACCARMKSGLPIGPLDAGLKIPTHQECWPKDIGHREAIPFCRTRPSLANCRSACM